MKRGKAPPKRAALVPGARVLLWARVSSREQREQGWSLPEQVREVQEHTRTHGWVIAQEFAVDESATRAGRDRFNELLELVERDLTIAAVVCVRLDRLHRSDPLDRLKLEVLRRAGLKLRFVKENYDENAVGNFLLGIRSEVAGFEIGLLKERIQEGYLGRAREGWFPRKPRYPYVVGDKTKGEAPIRLDPARPERAALARRLFEVVASGQHANIDDARQAVADEGHVYSAKSRVMPRPVAYKLLRDRFAYGEFEFQGVVYQGKHEPLVTRELWQCVQDVLDGRGGRPYGRGEVHYNGLVKCGLCGASMTGEGIRRTLKNGETKVYEYLRCSMSGNGHGKRGCRVPRLNVSEVEERLGALVESIAFDDDAVEVIRGALRESHRDHVERVERALGSFRRQLGQAEDRKKRAFTLALDAGLDGASLRAQVETIDAEVIRLQGEVQRLEGESRAYYEEGVRVIELAQRLYPIWLVQDSANKRAIIDCLVLNCTWDGVTLAPEWRKPFDLLVERPVLASDRGREI